MLREQREYWLYPVCGCTCILRQSDPAAVFLLDQDQITGDSVGHLCNDRFNCRYGGDRFFAKEIRPPDQRKAVKSIWKPKNDAVTAAVAEDSAAVNTEKIVPEKWNRKHASMKESG